MMNELKHKVLVEMVFGSHLYGTATEKSDKDFKGVFLPSMNEMLLGRVPKTVSFNTKTDSEQKNTSADVDRELYSLQYFFELAKKGETVALDMLHAPEEFWVTSSTEWRILHRHRSMFYTRNLSSFVGYARTQAAKYGVKGSRLADAKRVLEVLQKFPREKVGFLKDRLPSGEHCGFPKGLYTFYEVCGKKLTMTATAGHYVPMLENFIHEFGERARQAETNQGVDWKAISHAFRAGFQVKSILTEGDFTYPLRECEFLRQVKQGELHFKSVSPMLEDLMAELDTLSAKSTLPEKVDAEWCDQLLLDLLR
jgi:hypothetical protein